MFRSLNVLRDGEKAKPIGGFRVLKSMYACLRGDVAGQRTRRGARRLSVSFLEGNRFYTKYSSMHTFPCSLALSPFGGGVVG